MSRPAAAMLQLDGVNEAVLERAAAASTMAVVLLERSLDQTEGVARAVAARGAASVSARGRLKKFGFKNLERSLYRTEVVVRVVAARRVSSVSARSRFG